MLLYFAAKPFTLFEQGDPKFDADKTRTHGKIFVLDSEGVNQDGIINIEQ
jgi:hypothetical protein